MRYVTGLGVILLSTALLSGCNTVNGTAAGVVKTASGVGQTVEGAAVGAEKDLHATEKAMTPKKSAHYKVSEETHNAPAG